MRKVSQYLNSSQIQASFEPKKYEPAIEPRYQNDLKASGRIDFVKASNERQAWLYIYQNDQVLNKKSKEPQNETILFHPNPALGEMPKQSCQEHTCAQKVSCPQCGCEFMPGSCQNNNQVQEVEQRDYVPSPQLRSPVKAQLLQPKVQQFQEDYQNPQNNNQNYKFLIYLREKAKNRQTRAKQIGQALPSSEFQILLQEYQQQQNKTDYINTVLAEIKLTTQQFSHLLQSINGDEEKIKLVVQNRQHITDLQDKISDIARLLYYKSNIPKMKKQLGL